MQELSYADPSLCHDPSRLSNKYFLRSKTLNGFKAAGILPLAVHNQRTYALLGAEPGRTWPGQKGTTLLCENLPNHRPFTARVRNALFPSTGKVSAASFGNHLSFADNLFVLWPCLQGVTLAASVRLPMGRMQHQRPAGAHLLNQDIGGSGTPCSILPMPCSYMQAHALHGITWIYPCWLAGRVHTPRVTGVYVWVTNTYLCCWLIWLTCLHAASFQRRRLDSLVAVVWMQTA